MKIQKQDLIDYILGWGGVTSYSTGKYTITEIKSILSNSLAMLEDYQDGIEAMIERNKISEKASK